MKNSRCFSEALYGVGSRIRGFLEQLPDNIKEQVEEIRLREGMPIAITVLGDTIFVGKNGEVYFSYEEGIPIVSNEEITECFNNLCSNSIYAHEDEIKNGYVKMKNGCRAGICGTFSQEGYIRNITSLNIRIAHQIIGAASDIAVRYNGGGLLIAGPPGSGKTTVLRDLIRQLSSGATGRHYRVAVVDSRFEISGGTDKGITNDLGVACDLIAVHNKAKGIEMALRTLFPNIIAFDEIGTMCELNGVKESFHSGVSIITTAHIGIAEELLKRDITAELIKSAVINQIAVLPQIHGGKIRMFSREQLLRESEKALICNMG